MNTLEIFPWNAQFETGIEIIDVQHRGLVALLNELVGHLAHRTDISGLDEIFGRLKDYAVVHFRTEEGIWQEALGDDDWAVQHARSHRAFVDKIIALRAGDGSQSQEQIVEELAAFLTRWLALHIIDSDKRMARMVLNLRAGMPTDQARRAAEEFMAGVTRIIIETVMAMYDKLAVRTLQLSREISRREAAERELAKVLDDLARAKERAEASNRAKSAFLANISHEIRTPLNAIKGMAHLLRREGVSQEQAVRLAKIDEASEHLISVINDVLDLSKIEAGKLVLDSAPVDVEKIVGEVVSMLADEAAAKGLVLVAETEPMPEGLAGDPFRLKQALLNFASNAVKFTEAGRVTLRAGCAESPDGGVVLRLEVEDTGIGIEPGALSRIFSNFEQAEIGTSRKYGGTGLGLALTRKLAESMGGDVGVSSVLGKGSVFWLTAPLEKSAVRPGQAMIAQEAPAESAEETLRRDHAGCRVLLVEDNDINREIAQDILSDAGLVVDTAENGLDAVECARERRYDIILMDMNMPVMGGLEATRRIRQLPGGLDVPVIAMTANAFAEDQAKCLSAGMNDFIFKPVDPDLLFEVMLRWIGKESA